MKTVTISPAVADVLARAQAEGNRVTLPKGQLDRALYVDVDKVLKALGGKWNRHAGAHVFDKGIDGQLAEALAAGHVVDVKKSLEQFDTPDALAAHMCDLVDVRPTDAALEPSAGNGAIVRQLLARGAEVLAVEIDHNRVRELSSIAGRRYLVHEGDFMELELETLGAAVWSRAPTVIVMNPPFSRNQDVRHVRRAFDMLAPGGRLAAVMSEHAAFSQDRHSFEFCSWVSDIGASFEPLPENTFRESGTLVSTRLLVARN